MTARLVEETKKTGERTARFCTTGPKTRQGLIGRFFQAFLFLEVPRQRSDMQRAAGFRPVLACSSRNDLENRLCLPSAAILDPSTLLYYQAIVSSAISGGSARGFRSTRFRAL